jgi:hypothetical protein
VEERTALKNSPFAPWLVFSPPGVTNLTATIAKVIQAYPTYLHLAEQARNTLLSSATWTAHTRTWLQFLQSFLPT